ncbi:MAG: divergent PAP2 family protein [bacterium]|nr:divergent PAP2 family protein [bacterium]
MNTIKVLGLTLLSGTIAQLIKVFTYYIQHRKFNLKRFFETGGMPSSHASTAATLTFQIAFWAGFNTPVFASAAFFAFVIMYDAAGLRRAAGRQAAVINKIIDEFKQTHHLKEERLMELLGHTPLEVFFGAILGFVIAFIFK